VTVRWELGARALGKVWTGSYAWELPKSPSAQLWAKPHTSSPWHLLTLQLPGHSCLPLHWGAVGLWLPGKWCGRQSAEPHW